MSSLLDPTLEKRISPDIYSPMVLDKQGEIIDPVLTLAHRVAAAVHDRLILGENEIGVLTKYMRTVLKFRQDMEEKCSIVEQWTITEDPRYLPVARSLKGRILSLQSDIGKIHERIDDPLAHYSRMELNQKYADLDSAIHKWKEFCYEGNRIYDRLLPALLCYTNYVPSQPKLKEWPPELIGRHEDLLQSFITNWSETQKKHDQTEEVEAEDLNNQQFLLALSGAWDLTIANLVTSLK